MLYDDPKGWDGGGQEEVSRGGGIYVYLYLIHVVTQQKLSQHCKVIILQLKVKSKMNTLKSKKQNKQKKQNHFISGIAGM